MLKVSSYLTISAFFILMFVLFMAFNPGLYDADGSRLPDYIITRSDTAPQSALPPAYAVIGSGNAADTAALTLDTLRLSYEMADSVTAVSDTVRVVIIASPQGDVLPTAQFVEGGGTAVLCALPSESDWLSLCGVMQSAPSFVSGFEIYEGFLLGGMFVAETASFDCAAVSLSSGCKVFANGYDPDRDTTAPTVAREQKRPLIWRANDGAGDVYTVATPWLVEDVSMAGVGVLCGIIADIEGDLLYPVVGTKTVLLDGFPETEGSAEGNRTMYAFSRDIVFPDLVSIAKQFGLTYTSLASGGDVEFFASELYKQTGGELGTYAELGGISSGLFGWADDQTAVLPVTSSGVGDQLESLNFFGAVSAAGFTLHRVDMTAKAGVSDGAWNLYAVELSKYFSYIFKNTAFMRSETATMAQESVKNYLQSSVEITYGDTEITAQIRNNSAPLMFILRSEAEVVSSENCTYKKLEDGAYVITAYDDFSLALRREEGAKPARRIDIPLPWEVSR